MVTRQDIKKYLSLAKEEKYTRKENELKCEIENVKHYKESIKRCEEDVTRLNKTLSELYRAKFLVGKLIYGVNAIQSTINLVNGHLVDAKDNIRYYNSKLEYSKERIELLTENLKSITKEIKEIDEDKVTKIEQEILQIGLLKHVINTVINEQYLTIFTDTLYITEPKYKEKFYLGSCEIKIPLKMDYIENVVIHSGNSVFGYSPDMQHPHVFRDGNACWGTATNNLIYAFSIKSYLLATVTILSFLQTCDITDDAGRFVPTWGKVNEDGTVQQVIGRKVYKRDGTIVDADNDDGDFRCECCGDYFDIDRRIVCDCCGEDACDECCSEYETYEGYRYICNDCMTEQYVRCGCCDTLVTKYDAQYIEDEDKYVCPDCLEEYYVWNHRTGKYEYVKEEQVV